MFAIARRTQRTKAGTANIRKKQTATAHNISIPRITVQLFIASRSAPSERWRECTMPISLSMPSPIGDASSTPITKRVGVIQETSIRSYDAV